MCKLVTGLLINKCKLFSGRVTILVFKVKNVTPNHAVLFCAKTSFRSVTIYSSLPSLVDIGLNQFHSGSC
jgi:hypothetical protein